MKKTPNFIESEQEWRNLCQDAKNVSEAHTAWAAADPLGNYRKTAWDTYCYLRDRYEEKLKKVEARGFH